MKTHRRHRVLAHRIASSTHPQPIKGAREHHHSTLHLFPPLSPLVRARIKPPMSSKHCHRSLPLQAHLEPPCTSSTSRWHAWDLRLWRPGGGGQQLRGGGRVVVVGCWVRRRRATDRQGGSGGAPGS
jgi:hypothetical protein